MTPERYKEIAANYQVYGCGQLAGWIAEAADEIERLRTALVTIKVNHMRNGATEALYDYISEQLQQ